MASKARCVLSNGEQERMMSVEQPIEHTGEPLLKLNNVSKFFGGLAAVQDLDLEVRPKEIISVIGPNGAGKTTVFNLITGIYAPTSGDILVRGHRVNGQPAYRIAGHGVARTFQNIRLFGSLTVAENVHTAQQLHLRSGLVAAVLRAP